MTGRARVGGTQERVNDPIVPRTKWGSVNVGTSDIIREGDTTDNDFTLRGSSGRCKGCLPPLPTRTRNYSNATLAGRVRLKGFFLNGCWLFVSENVCFCGQDGICLWRAGGRSFGSDV